MLRTSLSRPLRQLSTSSSPVWRNVQYRLAHNVSTAQQQTQAAEGDKDASVTSAGPSSSSPGSTLGSQSESLFTGSARESAVSDSTPSLASGPIPLSSPSSFVSQHSPNEEPAHSTSTSASQTKKDPASTTFTSATTESSADALSTLPTYNLDEVKQRIRHWTEHAAVTVRERADEFTGRTKTTFSQLGAHLNKVTGYEEIEALKRDVVAQGEFVRKPFCLSRCFLSFGESSSTTRPLYFVTFTYGILLHRTPNQRNPTRRSSS